MIITWHSVTEPPKKSGKYWVVPEWVLNPNHYYSTDEMLESRFIYVTVDYDADQQKFFDKDAFGVELDVLWWAETPSSFTVADFLNEVDGGLDI